MALGAHIAGEAHGLTRQRLVVARGAGHARARGVLRSKQTAGGSRQWAREAKRKPSGLLERPKIGRRCFDRNQHMRDEAVILVKPGPNCKLANWLVPQTSAGFPRMLHFPGIRSSGFLRQCIHLKQGLLDPAPELPNKSATVSSTIRVLPPGWFPCTWTIIQGALPELECSYWQHVGINFNWQPFGGHHLGSMSTNHFSGGSNCSSICGLEKYAKCDKHAAHWKL